MYKLKYLPLFDLDLTEAEDYLYEFSLTAVDKLTQAVDEQVATLVKYPFMYPVYSSFIGNKEYRIMPLLYQFLCFYYVDEETKTINVYRLLHATRNISSIL